MRDAFARQRREIGVELHRDRASSGRPSRVKPGETMPSVPTLAAFRPSAVQMWRTKWTVEDLPLVPVTAAMVAGCTPGERGRHQRDAAARIGIAHDDDRPDRAAAARHRVRPGSPTAPRLTASATKAAPSWRCARQGGEQEAGLGPCGSRESGRQEPDRAATRDGGCRVGARRMSSLSRNATHSRVRPPPDRDRAAPAAPCVARRRDGARSPARTGAAAPAPEQGSTRSRAAAGLLQVARQDAVERHDALDDRLHAAARPPCRRSR